MEQLDIKNSARLENDLGSQHQTSLRMLNKKQPTDIDQDLMQRTVLKKREDFAINLRKKKHSEIIQTKRKSNMLKAFERTIVAFSGQDDGQQVGTEEFMDIKDLAHL